MTSEYVALALLTAMTSHVAAAPWLVAAPVPSRVSDNTPADEDHYYELQFNALDYATNDMRQRGAAYLDGLRRSLEDLLEPDRADIADCDVIAVDSTSTITLAPNEDIDAKTAEAKERALSCEARRRAATSVRGAAALALHTARLLGEGRDTLDSRREHQLIVRLARLLDSLASTVGFSYTSTKTQRQDNPQPDAESKSAAATQTTSPALVQYGNASSELVQEMVKCLEQQRPADPRASYLRCPPSAAVPLARRRRETRGVRVREMEDPSQYLSNVSKVQPGRTITNDQAGVVATRAQLEGHFQNPDLQRTRRFGSNYQGNDLAITAIFRLLSDV